MRYSKGKNGLKDNKETKLYFSKDGYDLLRGKFGKFGIFNEIFYGLYLTTKIEESAYTENIYDGKSSGNKIYQNILELNNTNHDNYLNNNNTELDWNNLTKTVNIPILNKFNDYNEFLKWSDRYIKHRSSQMLKKFNKIRYKSGLDKKGDS